jgi:hypothetical protein
MAAEKRDGLYEVIRPCQWCYGTGLDPLCPRHRYYPQQCCGTPGGVCPACLGARTFVREAVFSGGRAVSAGPWKRSCCRAVVGAPWVASCCVGRRSA